MCNPLKEARELLAEWEKAGLVKPSNYRDHHGKIGFDFSERSFKMLLDQIKSIQDSLTAAQADITTANTAAADAIASKDADRPELETLKTLAAGVATASAALVKTLTPAPAV